MQNGVTLRMESNFSLLIMWNSLQHLLKIANFTIFKQFIFRLKVKNSNGKIYLKILDF